MTGTLSGRSAGEDHNAATSILEGGLEQTHGDAESNTSASERSLVVGNRPRVTLELFEHVGDLELGLLNGKEEPCRRAKRGTRGLLGHVRANSGSKTKHLLDLLRGVFLAAAEHIGLGALGVAELMYLCL